jgi:serine/threonine protein kinase
MPSPTTTDEFLELVRKSGVVDEKRLIAYVEKVRAEGQMPAEPEPLARLLVCDGVLTRFQAEQLLQGKWRRFTIGKYKVLERLGSGGMGSVYLCEHMLMRRRVALKVLPATKAEDSSSLERFYREARAVAALDHPNIVRAYDIDQDDKLHFLVMEHVDGSNLQEIIKKTGPMDPTRAAHYMRQAALGLQHAHEKAALVHRDIKPGNILVDRNGIVKVLDMGLARFFHDEDDPLTRKYDENVLGTADYLAPEQALDSHLADIRADIYSLGATFYFCLTGRTPFTEGSVAQKLIWHQTRHPKSIRSLRTDVPDGIIAVIEKMMAKDVNARYQKPIEVADALDLWTQTPIPPPPEDEMPQFSLAAAPRSVAGLETGSGHRHPTELSPSPRRSAQMAALSGTETIPSASTPTVDQAPPTPPPASPVVGAPPAGASEERVVAPPPLPSPSPLPTPRDRPAPSPQPGREVRTPVRPPVLPAAIPVAAASPPPSPREARLAPAPAATNSPAPMAVPARAASLPEARSTPVAAIPVVAVPVATVPVNGAIAIPPTAVAAQPLSDSARAPVLVSSAVSPLSASAPFAVQSEPTVDEASWEDDTDVRVATARPRRSGGQQRDPNSSGNLLLLIGAAGVIFLLGMVGLGATIYFLAFSRPTPTTSSKLEREPIRVDPAAGQKLGTLLQRAKPNDRFIVLSDLSEADLNINVPGVILETLPGKPVVWKCPPPPPHKSKEPKGYEPKLLTIQAAERVQVRGFVLDGNNHADALIVLYSQCPGTKLEDLQLQNMRTHGIRVVNCEGAERAPVEISRVRIATGANQAGVYFDIQRHTRHLVPVIRYLVFRDCTFEGPGIAFRTPNAEFVDTRSVELGSGKLVVKP